MKRGKFITFEGSEGSGKSTQSRLVYQYLKKKKKAVVYLREPGGTTISEALREILLDVKNKKMISECEALLYMAARAQLVEEVIRPALKKGKIVLCDRFLDSTIIYQGNGNGLNIAFLKEIGKFVAKGLKPNLTFVFDLPTTQGFSRLKRKKDRIEQRSRQYHNRVRRGYLRLAKTEPRRVKLIKATRPRREIYGEILKWVEKLL
jgi:dTMP kinase